MSPTFAFSPFSARPLYRVRVLCSWTWKRPRGAPLPSPRASYYMASPRSHARHSFAVCLPPPQMDLDMAQEALQQREQELDDAKVGPQASVSLCCGGQAREGKTGGASCKCCAPLELLFCVANAAFPRSPACPQLAIEMKDEAIEVLRQYEQRCRWVLVHPACPARRAPRFAAVSTCVPASVSTCDPCCQASLPSCVHPCAAGSWRPRLLPRTPTSPRWSSACR